MGWPASIEKVPFIGDAPSRQIVASAPPAGRRGVTGFTVLVCLENDAQRLGHFDENVRRAQQLFSLVRCAHDRSQPRSAFRNDWVTHCRRKNSRLKQLLGEFKRFGSVSHVNRNDRRLARLELEATLL